MEITKIELISLINEIRSEIGHESVEINIKEIKFDSQKKELLILTPDRPDKSAVIGKGGWVVGRLKETLEINKIHVESYSDVMVQKYRMELALDKINIMISEGDILDLSILIDLRDLLSEKLESLSLFDFEEYLNINDIQNNFNNLKEENDSSVNHKVVVALSGGVDSSFSLIIAKYLGLDPLAVTVDPGSIILPAHFKRNIDELCESLGVKHEYLDLDFSEFVQESFEGRFHPCGRCSKMIHGAVVDYAKKNNIESIIFGDLLSTGSQSINYKDGLLRINLPAFLGVSKQDLQKITSKFGVKKSSYFGCPLLGEVQKKFPYMRRYSIQRILRETRAGVLEPGESLDLIWSLCKDFK